MDSQDWALVWEFLQPNHVVCVITPWMTAIDLALMSIYPDVINND